MRHTQFQITSDPINIDQIVFINTNKEFLVKNVLVIIEAIVNPEYSI